MKYILALDQGTTSSRAIVFDAAGRVVSLAQKEFRQIFPKPGWVEHDPEEIWRSQLEVAKKAIKKANLKPENIAAIGVTNQRETAILWDRDTGEAVGNAIVWQDRRTSDVCQKLKKSRWGKDIPARTGLVVDPYFSGSKVQWMLKNRPEARKKAAKGSLAFGTVDSWLLWKLTNGAVHATDVTNACRTMLYNIHEQDWDPALLRLFEVDRRMLPEVKSSSEVFGETTLLGGSIPIAGIAGDQQAALFGQLCNKPGMVKNTYGTGCFMLMNTGTKAVPSKNKLLTTIAWRIGNKTEYALEGSVFIAGAVTQWLRDGLQLIKNASEVEQLAGEVTDNGGVYFVPAFVGLGAPKWDPYARGLIIGITRGTNRAHIARAALESIAFQVADILTLMSRDSGIKISELRVDGGASRNNLLLQLQADLMNCKVVRPTSPETTALGAAYLAGLAVGYWPNQKAIAEQREIDREFRPAMPAKQRAQMLGSWEKAVSRSQGWAEDQE